MTPKQYHERALATESKPAALQIGNTELQQTLNAAIAAANVIDQLKKVIFYGRKPDPAALFDAASRLKQEAQALEWLMACLVRNGGNWVHGVAEDNRMHFNREDINKRLLHAAFGKFGESGELLEALKAQGEGQGFDLVNFIEEVGDGDWYSPLIADELQLPEECWRTANVAKLNIVRYASGFSPEAAKNRKKELEREVVAFVIAQYVADPLVDGEAVLADVEQLVRKQLQGEAA
jgi:hypothetical protein